MTLSLATAAGGGRVREGVTAVGCHDQTNFFPVSMAAARERVPAAYKLTAAPDGTATLIVTMFRCDMTVDGSVLPSRASLAAVAFQLDSSDDPLNPADDGLAPDESDHAAAASSGAILLDFYPLFVVTDSKRLADWFRAGTGIDARHVRGLDYRYSLPEPPGVAEFSLTAPRPAPSPFTVTGQAAVQRSAVVTVDEIWWQDRRTADGTAWRAKIAFLPHDDHLAPADVTVDAEDESELAQILGTPDGRAKDPFALSVLIDHFDAVKTVTRK